MSALIGLTILTFVYLVSCICFWGNCYNLVWYLPKLWLVKVLNLRNQSILHWTKNLYLHDWLPRQFLIYLEHNKYTYYPLITPHTTSAVAVTTLLLNLTTKYIFTVETMPPPNFCLNLPYEKKKTLHPPRYRRTLH